MSENGYNNFLIYFTIKCMTQDNEAYYNAYASRDPRFDGVFYVGVSPMELVRTRALKGVERVQEDSYSRTVQLGGHKGWIHICHTSGKCALMVEISYSLTPVLHVLLGRLRIILPCGRCVGRMRSPKRILRYAKVSAACLPRERINCHRHGGPGAAMPRCIYGRIRHRKMKIRNKSC
jgi:hypothetical protein